MDSEEEKMSDIQLTKLLLDIPQPFVSAQSWIVYDASGDSILFGRMERERREIASLTKMMTCFVVLHLA
jgi:D-alanyl-D-alanine carboxypeptidase